MSEINNKTIKKAKVVVTYAEIVVFAIVFLVILAVVYPQRRIQAYIRGDGGNPDLKAAYLKNMIEKHPEERDFWIALANLYMKTNRIQDASELLDRIHDSGSTLHDFVVVRLRFAIAKNKMFSSDEGSQERMNAAAEVGQILEQMILAEEKAAALNDMYQEATRLGFHSLRVLAVKKLREIDKGNKLYWLAEIYKLSLETSNYDQAIEYAKLLSEEDSDRRIYWIEELYKISLASSKFKDALEYAQTLASEDVSKRVHWLEECFKLSIAISDRELSRKYALLISEADKKNKVPWLMKLAKISLEHGEYKMSSQYYLDAMSESSSEQKKQLFIEAVKTLQSGNLLKEAVALSEKYENQYIDDDEVMSFLIKLHISADDLEGARRLSLKLAEHRK